MNLSNNKNNSNNRKKKYYRCGRDRGTNTNSVSDHNRRKRVAMVTTLCSAASFPHGRRISVIKGVHSLLASSQFPSRTSLLRSPITVVRAVTTNRAATGPPLGTPKLIAPQQPNPRHPTNHKLTALEAKWSGGAMEPEIVAFSPGATSTLCDDAPVEPRSFLIATGEGKPLKPENKQTNRHNDNNDNNSTGRTHKKKKGREGKGIAPQPPNLGGKKRRKNKRTFHSLQTRCATFGLTPPRPIKEDGIILLLHFFFPFIPLSVRQPLRVGEYSSLHFCNFFSSPPLSLSLSLTRFILFLPFSSTLANGDHAPDWLARAFSLSLSFACCCVPYCQWLQHVSAQEASALQQLEQQAALEQSPQLAASALQQLVASALQQLAASALQQLAASVHLPLEQQAALEQSPQLVASALQQLAASALQQLVASALQQLVASVHLPLEQQAASVLQQLAASPTAGGFGATGGFGAAAGGAAAAGPPPYLGIKGAGNNLDWVRQVDVNQISGGTAFEKLPQALQQHLIAMHNFMKEEQQAASSVLQYFKNTSVEGPRPATETKAGSTSATATPAPEAKDGETKAGAAPPKPPTDAGAAAPAPAAGLGGAGKKGPAPTGGQFKHLMHRMNELTGGKYAVDSVGVDCAAHEQEAARLCQALDVLENDVRFYERERWQPLAERWRRAIAASASSTGAGTAGGGLIGTERAGTGSSSSPTANATLVPPHLLLQRSGGTGVAVPSFSSAAENSPFFHLVEALSQQMEEMADTITKLELALLPGRDVMSITANGERGKKEALGAVALRRARWGGLSLQDERPPAPSAGSGSGTSSSASSTARLSLFGNHSAGAAGRSAAGGGPQSMHGSDGARLSSGPRRTPRVPVEVAGAAAARHGVSLSSNASGARSCAALAVGGAGSFQLQQQVGGGGAADTCHKINTALEHELETFTSLTQWTARAYQRCQTMRELFSRQFSEAEAAQIFKAWRPPASLSNGDCSVLLGRVGSVLADGKRPSRCLDPSDLPPPKQEPPPKASVLPPLLPLLAASVLLPPPPNQEPPPKASVLPPLLPLLAASVLLPPLPKQEPPPKASVLPPLLQPLAASVLLPPLPKQEPPPKASVLPPLLPLLAASVLLPPPPKQEPPPKASVLPPLLQPLAASVLLPPLLRCCPAAPLLAASVLPPLLPLLAASVLPPLLPLLAASVLPPLLPLLAASVLLPPPPKQEPPPKASVLPPLLPLLAASVLPPLLPLLAASVLPPLLPLLAASVLPPLLPLLAASVLPPLLPLLAASVLPPLLPLLAASVLPPLLPLLAASVLPPLLPLLAASVLPPLLPLLVASVLPPLLQPLVASVLPPLLQSLAEASGLLLEGLVAPSDSDADSQLQLEMLLSLFTSDGFQ
eukprot:gene843-480_t